MDRAFNTQTNTVEYAKQINEEYSDVYIKEYKESFACLNEYCRKKASPCCFGKKSNGEKYKKTAYFMFREHIEDCHFDEANGCVKKTLSNGNQNYVVAYVYEIRLPRNRIDGLSKIAISNPSNNLRKEQSGRASSRLAAAVIFYIQDPEKNSELKLKANGAIREYRDFFQMIVNKKGVRFKDNYIFYRSIKYTTPPVYENNLIKITLYQTEPSSGKYFELWLDTRAWSNKSKAIVVDSVKSKYEQAQNKKSRYTATVFFIGTQDKAQKHIFHCNFSEYFDIYYGEYFELPWNESGIEEDFSLIESDFSLVSSEKAEEYKDELELPRFQPEVIVSKPKVVPSKINNSEAKLDTKQQPINDEPVFTKKKQSRFRSFMDKVKSVLFP